MFKEKGYINVFVVDCFTILIPICANCGKVKDNNGDWVHPDEDPAKERGCRLTHSICPQCKKDKMIRIRKLPKKRYGFILTFFV